MKNRYDHDLWRYELLEKEPAEEDFPEPPFGLWDWCCGIGLGILVILAILAMAYGCSIVRM